VTAISLIILAALALFLFKPPAPGEVGSGLDALIVAAARPHGVHPALLKAIVEVESGFDPNAVRDEGNGRLSIGLGQILWPDTAQALGFPGPAERLQDPFVNLNLSAMLLRELMDRHGTVPHAISHYNCGRCPVEREYTRKVLALYEKYWGDF